MKLLLVFASALVLVAHGNVIPFDGEESVNETKFDYAGQEAGGVGPQYVFIEEAPAVRVFGATDEPRVSFSQKPQGAYAVEDPEAESVPVPETNVSIPIPSRACINAACVNVCHRLGYRYGICISPSSCLCSK